MVKLSVLVAALFHDFQHPGVSTCFLIKTGHELVMTYGETSTLERMHMDNLRRCCADDPDSDFMDVLSASARDRVLEYAHHLILATDMSRHMEFVNAVPPTDPERLAVFKLQLAMKCADLSHCVRKFSTHYAFVEKLKAEFYKQGDRERALKLPVSAGMDRAENYRQMAMSQDYFLTTFILPMYKSWSMHSAFNGMVASFTAVLKRNITSWQLLYDGPNAAKASAVATSTIPVRTLVKQQADIAAQRLSQSWSHLGWQAEVERMYGLRRCRSAKKHPVDGSHRGSAASYDFDDGTLQRQSKSEPLLSRTMSK